MRHTLRSIASGGEIVACGDILPRVEKAFKEWSEPTDESALSEKEGKSRGCF
jgi:hypothetical protein